MSFREKYTTTELIAKDTSSDKKEKIKIIISNDTYATCELLELLSHKMEK